MTSQSNSRRVTFLHPFQLPGMDAPHVAGTFDLLVEDEQLDLTWEAYHRTMTLMLTSAGRVEAWKVSDSDLEAALAHDRQQDVRGGHS